MSTSSQALPRKVNTLILGAGPAGLTAGFQLTKAGHAPIILERGQSAGGLMRSLKRGDFTLDIGRKELYSRIPEINDLWHELLGADYREYKRRIGVLYKGQLLEESRAGIPPRLLLHCGVDFLRSWLKGATTQPRNKEEYWHQRRGRMFTKIFEQNFQERFRGESWAELPPPESGLDTSSVRASVSAMKGKLRTLFSIASGEAPEAPNWHHPAYGTGQVCSLMEEAIAQGEGQINYGTQATKIETEDNRIKSVFAVSNGRSVEYQPEHLIASIPIEILSKLIVPDIPMQAKTSADKRRGIILVYLFLDESPRFPHTFIRVGCPELTMGRVANYAALNGKMVPPGKSCLCVEFFVESDSALLQLTEEDLAKLAIKECEQSNLIGRGRCFDQWVLKFPVANAATDYRDWLTEDRLRLMTRLKRFDNLLFVNRAGTDLASFAGSQAANAIVIGDRAKFDEECDPRRAG